MTTGKESNTDNIDQGSDQEVVPLDKHREEIRNVVKEREKWKTDARTLKEQQDALAKELEDLKLSQENAKLTKTEQYENQIQKLSQAIEERDQKLKSQTEQFTKQRVTTEALRYANEFNAYNSNVAINAFMQEHNTKVNEQGVVVSQDKDGIEKPLKDVMAEYFKKNDFLVSSNVSSGSGARQGFKTSGDWWKNPNASNEEVERMDKKQFYEYIEAKKQGSLPSNVKSFVR